MSSVTINFYETSAPYGCFSNFSKHPIEVDGKTWPTIDRYWGDGGDGRGTNRLGALLEQVRSELPPWPAPFTAPPWIEHPDIEPSDLFWRMGRGEDYLTASSRFYATLRGEAKTHFDAYFPVPKVWLPSWR